MGAVVSTFPASVLSPPIKSTKPEVLWHLAQVVGTTGASPSTSGLSPFQCVKAAALRSAWAEPHHWAPIAFASTGFAFACVDDQTTQPTKTAAIKASKTRNVRLFISSPFYRI